MSEEVNKNLEVTFDEGASASGEQMLPAKKSNYQLDLESQTLKDKIYCEVFIQRK